MRISAASVEIGDLAILVDSDNGIFQAGKNLLPGDFGR